jgi:hypothetical protein
MSVWSNHEDMKMRILPWFATMLLGLVGIAIAQGGEEQSPNVQNNAYFGDVHVHTG